MIVPGDAGYDTDLSDDLTAERDDSFERDYHKFLVLKKADIEKYLSDSLKALLYDICDVIAYGRNRDGRPAINHYVVVNTDELYAEDVWKLIERHGGDK